MPISPLAALLIVLAVVFPAYADNDPLGGDAIVNGCNPANLSTYETNELNDNNNFWLCVGAVTSAEDIMQHLGAICPPQGVSGDQELRVVYKYMQDNPNKLHLRYPTLIFNALVSAWPCGQVVPAH
jgi:hypothetical protein